MAIKVGDKIKVEVEGVVHSVLEPVKDATGQGRDSKGALIVAVDSQRLTLPVPVEKVMEDANG